MKDTEKEILEMLISGNHAREILEVGCEFLKLNFIVWLDVVPAPNELSESLFLLFFVSQYLRVSLGVKYLP